MVMIVVCFCTVVCNEMTLVTILLVFLVCRRSYLSYLILSLLLVKLTVYQTQALASLQGGQPGKVC